MSEAAAADAPAAELDKGSALYRAAVRIQASYRGYAVRKVPNKPCLLMQVLPETLSTSKCSCTAGYTRAGSS